MKKPRIIIDHLVGARRGRRQVFDGDQIVRFGRHPDSDVRFHAHEDIDASSRHAELRRTRDGGYVLCDVGSSNGTFAGDERVTELALEVGDSRVVTFGAGGPRVRVYVGDPDAVPPVPDVGTEFDTWTGPFRWLLAGAVALILMVAVVAWVVFV